MSCIRGYLSWYLLTESIVSVDLLPGLDQDVYARLLNLKVECIRYCRENSLVASEKTTKALDELSDFFKTICCISLQKIENWDDVAPACVTGGIFSKYLMIIIHVRTHNLLFCIAGYLIDEFLVKMLCDEKTTAKEVYFAQYLVRVREPVKATPILEDIIQKEWHYSTSLVVWPKCFSVLVDCNLQWELARSKDECLVLPSIVHACYLLADVYESIEDMLDRYESNLIQFEAFCMPTFWRYFPNITFCCIATLKNSVGEVPILKVILQIRKIPSENGPLQATSVMNCTLNYGWKFPSAYDVM